MVKVWLGLGAKNTCLGLGKDHGWVKMITWNMVKRGNRQQQ